MKSRTERTKRVPIGNEDHRSNRPASESAAATAARGHLPPAFSNEGLSFAYMEDLSQVENDLCTLILDVNDRGVAELYRADMLRLLGKYRGIAAGSSVDSPPAGTGYPDDDTAVPRAAFDRAVQLLRARMLRLPGGADDMGVFVECPLDWATGYWSPPADDEKASPPGARKLAGALSHLSRAEQWEIQALVLGRLTGSVEDDPDAGRILRGFCRLAPQHQKQVLEHLGGILAVDAPPAARP